MALSHWWIYTIVFILLAALSFFMAPPSWLVNRVVAKFNLHPTLRSDQVAVSINSNPMASLIRVTGPLRDRIVQDFNEAIFLDRFDILPRHDSPPPITIEIEGAGRRNTVVYALYPNGRYVEVRRTGVGKPVAYRLDSRALLEHLANGTKAVAR